MLKVVEHKLEVVEENVEAKIDVSCCALEARVDEKLAELTSSVEDRIKPLGELTQNSIVEAVDTYLGEAVDTYIVEAVDTYIVEAVDTYIVEAVDTYLGEEKDKEKSRLSVTVYNVPESTSDEGQERKQYDTDDKKILGVTVNITRAVRLGKKGTRPRLLMVQKGTRPRLLMVQKGTRPRLLMVQKGTRPRLLMVQTGNKQENAAIMRNCTNLRNENNPNDKIRKVFITPDIKGEIKKTRLSGQSYSKGIIRKKHCIREQQIHNKKREDSAEGTYSRNPPSQ